VNTIKISSDFKIELPLAVREYFNLKPGLEIDFLRYNGHVVLMPLRPIEKMRGFLKSMDSDIERDDEERV
jgi:bifunctional DNA-binding transcriptional regulator/antitoxin component of YhaV-PrlF toxin-antitoxin module